MYGVFDLLVVGKFATTADVSGVSAGKWANAPPYGCAYKFFNRHSGAARAEMSCFADAIKYRQGNKADICCFLIEAVLCFT